MKSLNRIRSARTRSEALDVLLAITRRCAATATRAAEAAEHLAARVEREGLPR